MNVMHKITHTGNRNTWLCGFPATDHHQEVDSQKLTFLTQACKGRIK